MSLNKQYGAHFKILRSPVFLAQKHQVKMIHVTKLWYKNTSGKHNIIEGIFPKQWKSGVIRSIQFFTIFSLIKVGILWDYITKKKKKVISAWSVDGVTDFFLCTATFNLTMIDGGLTNRSGSLISPNHAIIQF